MPLAVNLSPPITGTSGGLQQSALLSKQLAASRQFPPFRSRARPVAIAAESMQRKPPYLVAKAIERSRDTVGSESESAPEPLAAAEGDSNTEMEPSELGAEIKAAMEERKAAAAAEEKGREELLSGVVDEVREIEWPAFQKVLGTTGVVLGVIAGSSVVLLTVNFILAELSDRAFTGRGVQDFFG